MMPTHIATAWQNSFRIATGSFVQNCSVSYFSDFLGIELATLLISFNTNVMYVFQKTFAVANTRRAGASVNK